jgi:putative transposase
MTPRKHIISPGFVYHVFNRGIAQQPVFFDKRDYQRFLSLINYYRYSSLELRFSYFNRLALEERMAYMEKLRKNGQKNAIVFAFCLMDNHFHLLMKELIEDGIKKFIANLQNSYAKYINTKNKRNGSLFQEMFRAVRVETDEQFLHVARYIHLNPFVSKIVKNLEELQDYPWSSLGNYLDKRTWEFVDTDFLMSFYASRGKFMNFIYDQADFQKKLGEIKHLMIEKLEV